MDIDASPAMDEINMAIGRAVSSLITSGKQVEKNSILEVLKDSEKMQLMVKKTFMPRLLVW